MSSRYIDIMDTTYSRGFDIFLNSPVASKDFLPVVGFANHIGIDHFEISSPNIFKTQIENEDPFYIMSKFRDTVGADANLQILTNSLGALSNNILSEELITLFAKLVSKYDITTVRTYDALNDMQNLEFISSSVASTGVMSEVAIILHSLPLGESNIFNVDFYRNKIIEMLDYGVVFDSLAFIDPVGSIEPVLIYEVISMARELLGLDTHIRLSVSDSLSTGVSSYLAGLEAGVDGLDLAIAPFSGGSSSPDMLTVINLAKSIGYNIGDLDSKKIFQYQKFLNNQLKNYKVVHELARNNPFLLSAPVSPKELYKFTKECDKHYLYKTIDEVGNIMKKAGYAVSINPISKIILEQAYLNAVYEGCEEITKDFGKLILGYYGKTPFATDPDLVYAASEKLKMQINLTPPLAMATNDDKKSINYYKSILTSKNIEATDENIFIEASR